MILARKTTFSRMRVAAAWFTVWFAILAAVTVARANNAAITNPSDFDHTVHSKRTQLSGGAEIACASCHPLHNGLVRKRPNHAACFGSCHAAAPTRNDAVKRFAAEPTLCGACHRAPQPNVATNFRTPLQPEVVDRDFGLALSHQAHSSTACQACHRTGATKASNVRAQPHARCIQCHSAITVDTTFAITACGRCHTNAFGPGSTPAIASGLLAVTKAFSHQPSAHRQAPCATCHRAVTTSSSDVLEPPTMVSCGTSNCHDGKTTFATTQTCTRCHQEAPAGTFTIARPTKRFSHAAHNTPARLTSSNPTPCTSCHRNGNNEPTPPTHDACSPCHASDFASPQPTICGACHQSTEPWRGLTADQRPLPTSEFGAQLDHRSHKAPCTSCHTLTTTTTELRPARGHSSCSSCHRDQAAPALTQCTECHQPNLTIERNQQRLAAAWSTRRQFDHGAHGRAVATSQCNDCHTTAPLAGEIAAYPTPPKAACARCHNGQRAFSVTSTECRRCHVAGPGL